MSPLATKGIVPVLAPLVAVVFLALLVISLRRRGRFDWLTVLVLGYLDAPFLMTAGGQSGYVRAFLITVTEALFCFWLVNAIARQRRMSPFATTLVIGLEFKAYRVIANPVGAQLALFLFAATLFLALVALIRSILDERKTIRLAALAPQINPEPNRPYLDYNDYLQSPRWRDLRLQALDRDGWRCRTCYAHSSEAQLEIHHRRYADQWGTETVDDLTTLCDDCHETIEKRKRERIG